MLLHRSSCFLKNVNASVGITLQFRHIVGFYFNSHWHADSLCFLLKLARYLHSNNGPSCESLADFTKSLEKIDFCCMCNVLWWTLVIRKALVSSSLITHYVPYSFSIIYIQNIAHVVV